MKRVIFSLGAVIVTAASLGAGTLDIFNVHAGNPTQVFTAAPPTSSTASGSTVLTWSDSTSATPNRSYSYSDSAYLSFGHMGVDANASDSCSIASCGGSSASSVGPYLELWSNDYLVVNGASSGFVAMQFLVDGTLAGSGGFYADTALFRYSAGTGSSINSDSGALVIGSASLDSNGTPTTLTFKSARSTLNFSLTPDPSSPGTWDYLASGTVLFPFSSSFVQIYQNAYAAAGCYSSSQGRSCDESADFMNTVLLGAAVVLDGNGNPIPGATVASGSGWDYTQQLARVPEPTAFVMIGLGLAAIGFRRIRLS